MSAQSSTRRETVRTENAQACPVIQSIEAVGTPWRLNVIYALRDGERRFNELKAATEARSKTLSDALDALAESGVVTRRMEADAPVAVYYDLTPKGEDLLDVLADLGEWAERWGADAPDGPEARLRAD